MADRAALAQMRWQARRRACLVLVAGLISASCAGGTGEESAPTTPVPRATEGQQAGEVQLTETEYALELPDGDLTPGEKTFVVSNAGSSPHDLAISGPGLEQVVSDIVRSGETTRLSVELRPGTYTLWCTVGSHRALGMEAELVVAG